MTKHNKKPTKDHLGNQFESISSMVLAYDLPITCYRNRLRDGWSLADTLTTPVKQLKSNRVIYDHRGNAYYNLTDLANAYHVNYETLRERLRLGWDMEKALTADLQSTAINYKGKTYPSIKALAEHYKMNPTTLINRLHTLHWSIDEAVQSPVLSQSKTQIKYKGVTYSDIASLARAYHIKPSTLSYRLKNGWSIDQAMLTTPKIGRSTSVTYHNQTFNSHKDLAKHLDLDYKRMMYYLSKGKTVDEIIEINQKKTKSNGH